MDGVRLHAQVKSLDRALICEMVKKNNSKSKSGCLWSQVKRLWLTSALNHHRNLCHLCWHGQPGIREASERT